MSIHTSAFRDADAAEFLIVPRAEDDKYTRGVVGFVTGSPEYPGAAVLGVSAALHTGAGMVRFNSDAAVASLVLQRHPEVVCRAGRAHAWVLGSGVDHLTRSGDAVERMLAALDSQVPCVLDAGALDLVTRVTGPAVITPHASELARLFAANGVTVTAHEVAADPATWAKVAADKWNVCVLLKGHTTVIAVPNDDTVLMPPHGSEWLATAGTGDVLAGALGAILATVSARSAAHDASPSLDTHAIAGCAATASTLHAKASRALAAPFTAVELATGLSAARRALA